MIEILVIDVWNQTYNKFVCFVNQFQSTTIFHFICMINWWVYGVHIPKLGKQSLMALKTWIAYCIQIWLIFVIIVYKFWNEFAHVKPLDHLNMLEFMKIQDFCKMWHTHFWFGNFFFGTVPLDKMVNAIRMLH